MLSRVNTFDGLIPNRCCLCLPISMYVRTYVAVSKSICCEGPANVAIVRGYAKHCELAGSCALAS